MNLKVKMFVHILYFFCAVYHWLSEILALVNREIPSPSNKAFASCYQLKRATPFLAFLAFAWPSSKVCPVIWGRWVRVPKITQNETKVQQQKKSKTEKRRENLDDY